MPGLPARPTPRREDHPLAAFFMVRSARSIAPMRPMILPTSAFASFPRACMGGAQDRRDMGTASASKTTPD